MNDLQEMENEETYYETKQCEADMMSERIKENKLLETIGSEEYFESLEQLLKDHDHTFEHSDDHEMWKKGIKTEKQIQNFINLLSEKNIFRVEELVKKYSVMGGSIFRFNNKTIGDDMNGDKKTNTKKTQQ